MPPPVSWLATVAQIIESVENSSTPTFDRHTVGELFNLGRTAAANLLRRIPGAFPAGRTWMVHRRELLLWLYGIQREGRWESEARRRRRISRIVAAGDQRFQERKAEGGGALTTFSDPQMAVMRSTTLDSLPPGITVGPGRIEIRFFGWEDMMFHLGALVTAIDRDHVRLRQIIEE